jgi:uncharacterized RDD family membrane protein YckC
MSIFNFEKDPKYTSITRRGAAAILDMWIVLFLRVFTMQIMAIFWLDKVLTDFMTEFTSTFGTEEFKAVPEHIAFLTNHALFWSIIIFYFITIMVGAFYHAYLNASGWQGTVGKRLLKVMITTRNDIKISVTRGILHYFLAIMPFIYLSYIFIQQARSGATTYAIVTSSGINVVLGVLFIIWLQIQIFTQRRTAIHDLICNTVSVNGKTNNKWPWSKNKEETND